MAKISDHDMFLRLIDMVEKSTDDDKADVFQFLNEKLAEIKPEESPLPEKE